VIALEQREGIGPSNTGFADQRVSHFATGVRLPLRFIQDVQRLSQSTFANLLRLSYGA
jgi:hypothetical protein